MRNKLVLLLVVATAISACNEKDVPLVDTTSSGPSISFDEFLGQVYQESESGLYIVDGDTPIQNEKQLREFYDFFIAEPDSNALSVHTFGRSDARWSNQQKRNLTYCVSTSFDNQYQTMVDAMNEATAEWESAADIDFIHDSSQDDNCTAQNNNVLFDVRPINANGEYLARAFFPGERRSRRNVLVDSSSFRSRRIPLVGIIAHELGHTLGFRHEHTRAEAGGECFEDNSFRPLTEYDRDSVMHYPQCNGNPRSTLALTDLDRQGVASLYGPPREPEPDQPEPIDPPAEPTPETRSFSGSVNRDDITRFEPIRLLAGSRFIAQMTGQGDADLYVRFGGAPDIQRRLFDCRPYFVDANETCELDVPADATEVYIAVHGYTNANFTLQITFIQDTAPVEPPERILTETVPFNIPTGRIARGTIPVKPGSTFSAETNAQGDPNLYVRIPNTNNYFCRGVTGVSNERCEFTVPSDISALEILLQAASNTVGNLTVSYVQP